MAFSTEFVMGAGGAVEVEEIPVSVSGGGGSGLFPNVYPLATVDAGDGAWIWVDGPSTPASTGGSTVPYLQVGSLSYSAGGERAGGGGYFTGTVAISLLSRNSSASSFTGTVYVARV